MFKCLIWSSELPTTRIITESPENKENDKFDRFLLLTCKEVHKDSLIWSWNYWDDCPSVVHCEDHTNIPASKTQMITLKKQINLKKSKHHIVLGPKGNRTWFGPGTGRGLWSHCWGSAGGHSLWWRLFTPAWEEVKLLQPSCR